MRRLASAGCARRLTSPRSKLSCNSRSDWTGLLTSNTALTPAPASLPGGSLRSHLAIDRAAVRHQRAIDRNVTALGIASTGNGVLRANINLPCNLLRQNYHLNQRLKN